MILSNTHARMRKVVSVHRLKCSFVGDRLPNTLTLSINCRLKIFDTSLLEQDCGKHKPTYSFRGCKEDVLQFGQETNGEHVRTLGEIIVPCRTVLIMKKPGLNDGFSK